MSRLLSVSVPEELAAKADALARAMGKTKSEFLRDALRLHVQNERFAELLRYGRVHAERLGLGSEEVEDVIDEEHAAHGLR
jgi:metal-responsive CopG/Arc/MetJ family transcriptional regulator